jgi:hypothetical protein
MIFKAIVVLVFCSVVSVTVGLTVRDPAQPRSIAEAKATIASLLSENATLRKENAELKARIAELEGKKAKTLGPESRDFLAKLKEVHTAVENAADGHAVYAITKNAAPDLTALSARCGFQWGPFEPPKRPSGGGTVYHDTADYRAAMQEAISTPAMIVCRYPGSIQKVEIEVGRMTQAQWGTILDILSQWEKAAAE